MLVVADGKFVDHDDLLAGPDLSSDAGVAPGRAAFRTFKSKP